VSPWRQPKVESTAVGLLAAKVCEVEVIEVIAGANEQKIFYAPFFSFRLISRLAFLCDQTAQYATQRTY